MLKWRHDKEERGLKMSTFTPSLFYNNIADLLEVKGWSFYRLAKEAGINRQNFVFYRRGECVPSVATAILIADALEVTLDELVGRNIYENYSDTDDFSAFGYSVGTAE